MINQLDLKLVNARYQAEIEEAAVSVIRSGRYILGPNVEEFERELSEYMNVKHVIGISNGLDALRLIFQAYIELGKLSLGDEVLVPDNSFIASALALSSVGLKPVFIAPNERTYNLDLDSIPSYILDRVKAVMLVHLYGRITWSPDFHENMKNRGILVVEDNAQAVGAKYNGVSSGTLGNAGAMSFYPGKNLGAMGDAGGISTNDDELAELIYYLRNYGSKIKYYHDYLGHNCRLDEIQAAILRVKLKYLDDANRRRREIAANYCDGIQNDLIKKPLSSSDEVFRLGDEHIWHQYVIRTENRDGLAKYMADNQIGS